MAHIATQTILINNDKGGSVEGLLHLTMYDKHERIKRAAGAWVGFWLLAILSVPIMLAHFVLVPAFLILGPFFAYRRYNASAVPKEVTGRCPTCQEEICLPLEATDSLPMWTYCPANNDPVQLLEQNRSFTK